MLNPSCLTFRTNSCIYITTFSHRYPSHPCHPSFIPLYKFGISSYRQATLHNQSKYILDGMCKAANNSDEFLILYSHFESSDTQPTHHPHHPQPHFWNINSSSRPIVKPFCTHIIHIYKSMWLPGISV
jgi:hypothetical protein